LKKISEPDGGIEGFIAFLDDDEDGLISLNSLMRLLRREGVFEEAEKGKNLSLCDFYCSGMKEGIFESYTWC
jgi:hypothetical protein